MNPYALQARWLIPVDRPPIAGGILSVADGRIVVVGENTTGRPPTDLGDVALLPGFVNAHTHLEFSLLDGPLGTPCVAFPDWIMEVVAWRRRLAEEFIGNAAGLGEYRRRAIAAGLAESQRGAVAALGEIASPGFPVDAFTSAVPGPHCTVFMELLGIAPDRKQSLLSLASSHLAAGGDGFRRGLSPHAPYTVGLELLRSLCRLSAEARAPLAMHLAESRVELQLLREHTGPLVELLKKLDAWFPSALPTGLRPLDYLESLQNAHRALVIHGNYLAADEIELIAARRESMSVVYCPRTHAYFRRRRYPLEKMLAAGVRVAVGTDSRASNPDLSVLAELRHIARHHRNVAPAEIIRMGTLTGAEALGLNAEFGSLATGKRATLAVVPILERQQDPCEQILHNEMPPLPWPPVH